MTQGQEQVPEILQTLQKRFNLYWNVDFAKFPELELRRHTRRLWAALDDMLAKGAEYPHVRLHHVDAIAEQAKSIQRATLEKLGSKSAVVAIVDTETTGIGEHDEPVSVGAILLEVATPSGNLISELGSFYGLREPGVPIHPRAQAVHGLGVNELRGKELNRSELASMIAASDLVVAHNAKFDRRMLARIVPTSKYATWACSLHGLRLHWRGNLSRSLDALCVANGIERPRPHNALDDCRALKDLLSLRSEKTERSRTYLGHLIANPWAPTP